MTLQSKGFQSSPAYLVDLFKTLILSTLNYKEKHIIQTFMAKQLLTVSNSAGKYSQKQIITHLSLKPESPEIHQESISA